MEPVGILKAPNQNKQIRSLRKTNNSAYSQFEEERFIISDSERHRDYCIKTSEPTSMRLPKINSTYQKLYQRTYLHSEMLDPKDILISFGVITNNKNENHPT